MHDIISTQQLIGKPSFRMEAIAVAVVVHSLAMAVSMSIYQAFFPAATATASFVAMVAFPSSKGFKGRRDIARTLTTASLLFVLLLGLAVEPHKWLYESMGAFYLFVLVVCTFSASHEAGEAISGCMLSVLLAAATSLNSSLAIGFRWTAAGSAVASSFSCIARILRGTAVTRQGKFLNSGGPFDIELAFARLLMLPLMLTVVYAQSTESHSLSAGEVIAALIVATAVISARWDE